MGFIDFANGDVFDETAADLLMRQTVITCTSGTRPAGPTEGMTVYETDTDTIRTYDGSAWRPIGHASTWTSYTPSWTASSSNPSLGNGTLAGRYRRLSGDDLLLVQLVLTAGSTTTYGAGFWRFSLPFAASTTTAGYTGATGSALLLDNSAAEVGYRTAVAWLQSATTIGVVSSTGGIGATDPFTWATGDQVRFTFHYQPA